MICAIFGHRPARYRLRKVCRYCHKTIGEKR